MTTPRERDALALTAEGLRTPRSRGIVVCVEATGDSFAPAVTASWSAEQLCGAGKAASQVGDLTSGTEGRRADIP